MFKFGAKKKQLEAENHSLKRELAEVKNSTDISINDIERLGELFDIQAGAAGTVVNSRTSMKVAVVYACNRLISGAIQQLPIHTFDAANDDQRKRVKDDVYSLLNLQPTPSFSAAAFWEYLTSSMLLEGDGFAVIYRDRRGNPVEFLPVNPVCVQVERVDGRLQYYIQIDNQVYGFDQDDVLHFPGFGFNGLRSMSVIKWGALNSIGLELAMEDYSSDFFKNGAHQSIAIVKEGKWDQDQRDAFRESWVKTYSGVDKKKYPLVLDKTADVKQLSVNSKDSQLLESREFQITDIARAFGLPSFMVNQEQKSTSWGSGISEIALSFLRFTLMPHINRFEQELNRKLYMRTSLECEFVTAGLMRGTMKERFDAYRQALGGSHGPGWMSQNEIRKMDGLPIIDNKKYDELYDPRSASIASTSE